jgi:hypothetical protein
MIDSARLDPLLADLFARIHCDVQKRFILLGDLASIVPVLPNIIPKSSLTNFGLITARRKGNNINPPLSLNFFLTLSASDTATELSEFYGNFFESGVDERNLRRFLVYTPLYWSSNMSTTSQIAFAWR